MATTYQMQFDFSTAEEKETLKYLQAQGYTLLAYKGASGTSQIAAGVPTWFAVPFGNIFGTTNIDYTPTYKIYVFNQSQIAANTTIQMQSLSGEVGLGSAMTFKPDGDFVSGGVSGVPSDSIGLKNDRPSGTPDVTVGLAGVVNLPSGRQYLPFCAFTLPPQNSIIMKPLETILMVAARLNIQSGNVQANAAAPGCTFEFSASAPRYYLDVTPSTYAITNVPGTTAVTAVDSGATIGTIVNK